MLGAQMRRRDAGPVRVVGSSECPGDNPVSFVVSSNAGTDARVGTITVRDKVVLITQAGK